MMNSSSTRPTGWTDDDAYPGTPLLTPLPGARPAPNIAVVFLHGRCAMSCPFCISDEHLGSMTPEQYAALLETISASGFDQVVLGGGEPCEWPFGWRAAAAAAKERGFLVQLGTNGLRLTPGFETFDGVDRYVLPLDGAASHVHNSLRPLARPPESPRHAAPAWLGAPERSRSGHFEVITDRLEALRAAGRETTVSTVVTSLNQGEIPALAALLNRYTDAGGRVHAWHLYRFLPHGRGGARHRALETGDTAYNAAVDLARRMARVRVFRRPDMRHSATVDFFWYEEGRMARGSMVWAGEENGNAVRTGNDAG